jgi:hypothetical protein
MSVTRLAITTGDKRLLGRRHISIVTRSWNNVHGNHRAAACSASAEQRIRIELVQEREVAHYWILKLWLAQCFQNRSRCSPS